MYYTGGVRKQAAKARTPVNPGGALRREPARSRTGSRKENKNEQFGEEHAVPQDLFLQLPEARQVSGPAAIRAAWAHGGFRQDVQRPCVMPFSHNIPACQFQCGGRQCAVAGNGRKVFMRRFGTPR